jgi:hypothetical protein
MKVLAHGYNITNFTGSAFDWNVTVGGKSFTGTLYDAKAFVVTQSALISLRDKSNAHKDRKAGRDKTNNKP